MKEMHYISTETASFKNELNAPEIPPAKNEATTVPHQTSETERETKKSTTAERNLGKQSNARKVLQNDQRGRCLPAEDALLAKKTVDLKQKQKA